MAATVALVVSVVSAAPVSPEQLVWPELTLVTRVWPVRSAVMAAPVVSEASVESAVPRAVRVR